MFRAVPRAPSLFRLSRGLHAIGQANPVIFEGAPNLNIRERTKVDISTLLHDSKC